MKSSKRLCVFAAVLLVAATTQQVRANTNDIDSTVKSLLVEQGKQLTLELQAQIKQSLAIQIQRFKSTLNVEQPPLNVTTLTNSKNKQPSLNNQSADEE